MIEFKFAGQKIVTCRMTVHKYFFNCFSKSAQVRGLHYGWWAFFRRESQLGRNVYKGVRLARLVRALAFIRRRARVEHDASVDVPDFPGRPLSARAVSRLRPF